jgi:hypothetical protein
MSHIFYKDVLLDSVKSKTILGTDSNGKIIESTYTPAPEADTLDIVLGRGDTSATHGITLTAGTLSAEQLTSTDDADVNDVLTTGSLVTDTGGITLLGGQDIKPSVDSTTAINIAQADGTDFVTFDSTNKRIGVMKTPVHVLDIACGTLASAVRGVNLIGTFFATPSAITYGMYIGMTGSGTTSQTTCAMRADYLGGYTGSGPTRGSIWGNSSAGTGTNMNLSGAVAAPLGNIGNNGLAVGTTTGTNLGMWGIAQNGNVNYGTGGSACIAKNSATNIGVAGFAVNTGTSPIQIGGYFHLGNAVGTYESGALIADNGTTASPIFIARDNGTAIFNIIDGGNVGIGTAAPGEKLEVTGNIQLTSDNNILKFGTAEDASITFDSNSLNITANLITATDALELTGGYVKSTGGILGTITTVTDTYTVLYTDQTVICDKATAFTVTMPTAVVGQKFAIKNIGVGTVTISGAGGTDTIDGSTTATIIQWDAVQLQCYAANKWGTI